MGRQRRDTSFRCPLVPLFFCPPILLSATFACICCGYAKDAMSLFGISNEPQWLLPSHYSLPPSLRLPLPQKWPKKPHQRPGPFAVWGTWAATFASALGSIAQPRNRLIGRPLLTPLPLLSPAINTSLFLSWANKCSRRAGKGNGGCIGKWVL